MVPDSEPALRTLVFSVTCAGLCPSQGADSVQEGEVAALFVTKYSWYTLAFRDTNSCTVVRAL